MINTCLRWSVSAWLVAIVAAGLMGVAMSLDAKDALGALGFTALSAAAASPLAVVPSAIVAALLDQYWTRRPSRLVLGLGIGFLATAWTLMPSFVLMGTIAGGTSGWLADREFRLFSGRWLLGIGLGGVLTAVAGLALMPLERVFR